MGVIIGLMSVQPIIESVHVDCSGKSSVH